MTSCESVVIFPSIYLETSKSLKSMDRKVLGNSSLDADLNAESTIILG